MILFIVKALIRHQNFIGSIRSLTHINLFNYNDIVVQMASCSYDSHVQEIMGAFIVGSSIVMLRPQGNMNFYYLFTMLSEKQVSYMQSVPAYLSNILDFFLKQNCGKLNALRTIDVGGKRFAYVFRNSDQFL
jgi:non-ribosomal peptide synthetase component E (peptide arylation enzyme)